MSAIKTEAATDEAGAPATSGAFIEAVGEPAGGIWTIRVIRAGEVFR